MVSNCVCQTMHKHEPDYLSSHTLGCIIENHVVFQYQGSGKVKPDHVPVGSKRWKWGNTVHCNKGDNHVLVGKYSAL